eukprot:14799320-Alexandrium_andersonii.AAC.1
MAKRLSPRVCQDGTFRRGHVHNTHPGASGLCATDSTAMPGSSRWGRVRLRVLAARAQKK